MIIDHLNEANLKNALAAVEEALDIDHLQISFQRDFLNFFEVLRSILAILEKLCAPIRDDLICKLKEEKDLIELFRFLFFSIKFIKKL